MIWARETAAFFSLLLLVKAIARIIHVKPDGSIITNRGQQHMARNTTFYPKCLFTYTWFLYIFCLFSVKTKLGKKDLLFTVIFITPATV